MVGQYPGVEHVGIGQQDVGVILEFAPCVGRRVAIVGAGDQGEFFVGVQVAFERAKLVLRQRFGWIQIQRARLVVIEERFQYGHVVTKRLAAGRPRHHHDMTPGSGVCDRLGLVRVEFFDPLNAEYLPDTFGGRRLECGVSRLARGELFDVDDLAVVPIGRFQVLQEFLDVHGVVPLLVACLPVRHHTRYYHRGAADRSGLCRRVGQTVDQHGHRE